MPAHSDCASTFLPAYVPIMMRRKDLPYTEEGAAAGPTRRPPNAAH